MSELPRRKGIRLREYDYSQNGAYFVTICSYERKHLFGDIVGATLCGRPGNPHKMLEKWLCEIPNKYLGVIIDKYVIMPNHVHILFIFNDNTAGDHIGSPLQRVVGWFKTMTANEYISGVKNNIYQPFEKQFWQRSYHDHIIRNREDYIEIWKYIDENPVKWEEDTYYM